MRKLEYTFNIYNKLLQTDDFCYFVRSTLKNANIIIKKLFKNKYTKINPLLL